MQLDKWMQWFSILAVVCFLMPGGDAVAGEPVREAKRFAQLTFCVPPKVWSKRRKRCVNPFVRAEPARAVKPDLARVQECLNTLGYEAGPVDGQPGQRTRGAWNDFREDKGLGGPLRRFTDPKTLERLFTDCDAKKSQAADGADPEPKTKPKVVAEPEPQPDPEPAAAPTAAASAYPEVLCVSKSLHKQISKLVGKSVKLKLCGEACVPIPPGTPNEQLQKSEQEYAVKWCRNCIQIGASGLVCGQNP